MKGQISYKKAMEELDAILDSLGSAEPDVDEMTQKVSRAVELIKICEQKLSQTDREVQAAFKEMEADMTSSEALS